MFGSVSRRGHDSDLERAQIDHAVIRQRLVIEPNFRLGARPDLGAGLLGDLAVARDEVCVQMGIQYMCQLDPALGGDSKVLVHVAERIDQDPLLRMMGPNQVGGIPETFIHKRLDKPGRFHAAIIIAPRKEKVRRERDS